MDPIKCYGMEEIRARYKCGVGEAYRIIREVKSLLQNGGKLSGSKVLPAELEYWESVVDVKKTARAEQAPERPRTVCLCSDL